jgi:hypothetical protein
MREKTPGSSVTAPEALVAAAFATGAALALALALATAGEAPEALFTFLN